MNLQKDQITEHFAFHEFACDGDMISSEEFIKFVVFVLEPFRIWYNRTMNVNRHGGYRTPEVNEEVGGVSTSLHLRAMAGDFNFPEEYMNATPARQKQFFQNVTKKWYALCKKAGGFGQICWYDGFMHLGLSWDHEYFEDKRKGYRGWKI